MSLRKVTGLRLFTSVLILGFLSSCEGPTGFAMQSKMAKLASTGGGAFNGTWNVKLKASRDGCGLGLVGKTQPAKVIIVQTGSKIKLSISGLPKAFSGKVNGSSANASGTYAASGLSLTGSISASKQSTRKIKISSATLKIKGSGTNCTVVFSGSGSKA